MVKKVLKRSHTGVGGSSKFTSRARAPAKSGVIGVKRNSNEGSAFRQSFRNLLQPKTILLLFYDLLFWALLFVGMIAYPRFVESAAAPFGELDVEGILDANPLAGIGVAEASDTIMRTFLLLFIAITAIWMIWNLIAWTFTRGMIWRNLVPDALEPKFFWLKLAGLSAIWSILLATIWFIVYWIVGRFIPYNSFVYPGNAPWLLLTIALLLFITLYFGELLYYTFARCGRIFTSLRATFVVGVREWRKLLPANLIVVGMFVLISIATFLFSPLPESVINVLSSILLLLYFAWVRYYLVAHFTQVTDVQ